MRSVGPAVERLRASAINEVAVTNTIRIPDERIFDKLKVLSIAGLMAKAIATSTANQSVMHCSSERITEDG